MPRQEPLFCLLQKLPTWRPRHHILTGHLIIRNSRPIFLLVLPLVLDQAHQNVWVLHHCFFFVSPAFLRVASCFSCSSALSTMRPGGLGCGNRRFLLPVLDMDLQHCEERRGSDNGFGVWPKCFTIHKHGIHATQPPQGDVLGWVDASQSRYPRGFLRNSLLGSLSDCGSLDCCHVTTPRFHPYHTVTCRGVPVHSRYPRGFLGSSLPGFLSSCGSLDWSHMRARPFHAFHTAV